MKKVLYAILPLFLAFLITDLQAQQLQIGQNRQVTASLSPQSAPQAPRAGQSLNHRVQSFAPAVTCGPDTVDYTRAKLTGSRGIGLDAATSADSLGQWFDAPQAITLHGFGFFGFVSNSTADTVPILVQVYNAGVDSLPTGAPLRSDTIYIDSSLTNFEYYKAFSTPVVMTQPYVLVLTRPDTINDVTILSNDYTVGDGQQEWLGMAALPATGWRHGWNLFLGPNTFDADWLFMPMVTYDVTPSFTTTPATGCPGTNFNFTNAADSVFFSRFYNIAAAFGTPELSFFWDYGDGAVDTLVDGSHAYSSSGTYTVVLRDTVYGWRTTCADSFAAVVNVISGVPVSNAWTFAVNNLDVTFTNTSTGGIARLWDFGDGNFDTTYNAMHTYAANGTYTVCLTEAGPCDTVTVCSTITVGCTPPSVAFTASVSGQTATFTNTSTGGTQRLWDFGDGNFDTVMNPTHVYANNGTYTVCLTESNLCDTITVCQTVQIGCTLPISGFTYTQTGAVFDFADATQFNPISWSWDFGDGSQVSTQQNPTHTYTQNGTYIVCLTATNSCGPDLFCDTIVVNCPVPTPNFTATSTGNTAFFTDQSANATTWAWTFGDGGTSNQQNPTHTYVTTGTYNVCLTTTNQCGSSVVCNQVTITCPPPASVFSFLANGGNVNFQSAATGGATSWWWDFGDGTNSSAQNPSHFYQTGSYTVCLVVSNNCGSDTSCQTVQVVCPTPTVQFNYNVSQFTVSYTDQSTGGASAWVWDMGDGTVYQTQNVTHTYAGPGNYNACLTSTNDCGSSTVCQTVTVNCDIPVAAFISAANFGTVSFVDQSTFTPSLWLWDFGDGTTSTLQNPTHVFQSNGNYVVCLSAGNTCGSNNTCDTVNITVVGIEEPAFGQSLELYPNPTNGQVFVKLQLPEALDLRVSIVDLLGREVRSYEELNVSGTYQREFNLSNLGKGIYMLRIESEQGSLVRKIIKE